MRDTSHATSPRGRRAIMATLLAGLLLTPAARAQTGTWNVDAAGNWTNTANWLDGVVPNGVGDTAVFGNVIGADRVVTLDASQTVGAITFDDNNRYTISGANNLRVDDAGHVASIDLLSGSHTIASPIFLADSLRVTVANGSTLSTSGNIGLNLAPYAATSQTLNYGAIIKEGDGIWEVTGGAWTTMVATNSYANPSIFVNDGTLKLNATVFGGRNLVIASGATVQLTGGAFQATHTFLDGGTITGTNNFNSDIYSIYTTGGTISTGSANTVYTGFWKVGPGTLTITGAFTGSFGYGTTSGGLNLYEGTVSLEGANGALAFTGSTGELRVLGGRLALDNSITNNNNRLANAATGRFVLRGGELDIRSNAATALNEAAAPLALLGGGKITLSASGAAGGSLLTFSGAMTRVNQGTVLVRAGNLGDAIGSGVAQVKFGTAPTLSNAGTAGTSDVGILPFIVADKSATGIGTDLATYDATTGIRPLTAGEYAATLTAGQNVKLTGSGSTAGATVAVNALVLNSSGGSLDLDNTGQTLTVNSAAILSTGDSANTITGGTITGETHSALGGATREVIFHTARNLGLTAVVADSTGAVRLVKAGAATLTLSEVNTHTGGTYVNDGTVLLTGANNILPDAQHVFVANGTLDLGTHSETIGSLNVLGGKVTGSSGVLSASVSTNISGQTARIHMHGGEIDAVIGGSVAGTMVSVTTNANAGNNVYANSVLSGNNTFSGSVLVTANNTLTIRHGSALGLADGTTANGTTVNSPGALALEGGITVGNEALTLNGTGQSFGDNLGPWAVARRGALVNVSGDNTWGGAISINSTANIGSDAGSLRITGNITVPGTDRSLRLQGESNGANEISGTVNISNGQLFKDGLGTWRLSSASSNYTGTTTVYNGTLEVANLANAGNNSSIGAATGAASVIQLGSAVLSYVGAADSSTDRQVNLIGSGNLSAAGAGTVTYANATAAITSATNQNLALIGTGAGVIATPITTGTGALTKMDLGTWTLEGANTYSGGTHVHEGTLLVNNTTGSGTGSGPVVVSGGILGGSGSISGATFVLDNAGIAPGASGGASTDTLTFQDITFDAGSTLFIDIAGPADFDQLVASALTILAGSILDVSISFDPPGGSVFDILDWTTLSGTFDTVNLPALSVGKVWDATNLYTTGELIIVQNITVPEPMTSALLAVSGLLLLRRRRRC